MNVKKSIPAHAFIFRVVLIQSNVYPWVIKFHYCHIVAVKKLETLKKIIRLIWFTLEINSYQQRAIEEAGGNALIMNSEKCVELVLQAVREPSAFSIQPACANCL